MGDVVNAPWWAELGPVETTVACGGGTHTLRWADGELTAVDHPDPERERALVALGGQPQRCLDLTQLWQAHVDDLDVLVLAPRGPSDPITRFTVEDDAVFDDDDDDDDDDPDDDVEDDTDDDHDDGDPATYRGVVRAGISASSRVVPAIGFAGHRPGPHFGWFAHGAPPFVPGDPGDDIPGVGDLLLLGGGVGERLTAGVIGIWCDRLAADAPECATSGAALFIALASRVTEAVRSWLGDPELEVTVHMAASPSARRLTNGSVEVSVGFEWLRDVWMQRRSVLLGRLALTCTRTAATGYQLLTVGPDLGAPASTTVSW